MASSDAQTLRGSGFHRGELRAQEAAGVRVQADRVARIIGDELPPIAQAFLAGQRMVVTTTLDSEGRPRPSVMLGEDLLHARDPRRLSLPVPAPYQARLAAHLPHPAPIGLLVLDALTRRRMRINGRAAMQSDHSVAIDTEAVYSNCPKYIRPRRAAPGADRKNEPRIAALAALEAQHHERIAAADTFFLATHHVQAGADASHRGGDPGVLQLDGNVLSFPDYAGNNLYNTVGNLLENPQVGVAIPDFTNGRILEIAGRARIRWQEPTSTTDARVKARIEVAIEAAWQIEGAFAAPWIEL